MSMRCFVAPSTMATIKPRPSRDKVRTDCERLRAQGLRPIQIWVPDVRSTKFKAAAHRQSLAVAQSRQERDDQAFIASLAALNEV